MFPLGTTWVRRQTRTPSAAECENKPGLSALKVQEIKVQVELSLLVI